MSQDNGKSSSINAAVDAIVDALQLKPAGRKAIVSLLRDLQSPFPKLQGVRFYPATTRHGGIQYRATYRVPGHPLRTERLGRLPAPAYKRAVRISEIMQQVKANLMKAEDAYRELYVDSTPIDRHIQAFEKELKASGVVEDYRLSQVVRVRRCVFLGEYTRLGDINKASLPALIEALKKFEDPKTRKRLSSSTINYYLQALKQFVRWAVSNDRLREDPLQLARGVKNSEQQKRRHVLPEELAEIIDAARAGERRGMMSGADRAMLYLVAYGTGLRRSELRAIEVPWVKLDSKHPRISVPGEHTKDGKDAEQPLPEWLAVSLRQFIGDRKTGPLWETMPANVAALLEWDRQRARVAWIEAAESAAERNERAQSSFLERETSDGEIVFHSLRHSYATDLVANMDVKSAQLLTRHATTQILIDRYAHGRRDKAAEGVERAIKDPTKQGAAQGAAHLVSE